MKTWSKLLDATASGRWFEYDNAQQLRSARNTFNQAIATEEQDYAYDRAGNRTSDSNYNPTFRTGTFRVYTPNTINQLADVTTTVTNSEA